MDAEQAGELPFLLRSRRRPGTPGIRRTQSGGPASSGGSSDPPGDKRKLPRRGYRLSHQTAGQRGTVGMPGQDDSLVANHGTDEVRHRFEHLIVADQPIRAGTERPIPGRST